MNHLIVLIRMALLALTLGHGANLVADDSKWLKSTFEVKQVLSGDRFSIDFNGIALVVKLVSLRLDDENGAKAFLEEKIKGKSLNIIPEQGAGLSPKGFQLVYAILKEDGGSFFVNEQLILEGFASHVGVESKKYERLQTVLQKATLKKKTVRISQNPGNVKFNPEAKVCSELYSKRYCILNCRWAKLINPQSRIIYTNYEAAEKVGKNPCSSCLYERVKQKRMEERKSQPSSASKKEKKKAGTQHTGALFGLKKDKRFYSPISKKIARASEDDVISFSTVAEAKADGRKPDPASLRIDSPILPAPTGKECIGRSLPFLRPCRIETDHPTGLCEPCLNGRAK